MSGLEVMGMFFSIILFLIVSVTIVWIIGSTWKHGDYIDALEAKVRMMEDRYRSDMALNIENEILKHKGKANGRRIKKSNTRKR